MLKRIFSKRLLEDKIKQTKYFICDGMGFDKRACVEVVLNIDHLVLAPAHLEGDGYSSEQAVNEIFSMN